MNRQNWSLIESFQRTLIPENSMNTNQKQMNNWDNLNVIFNNHLGKKD
ncbi:hypothetical protein pb186bvf_020669 [Paramecium bursaria]